MLIPDVVSAGVVTFKPLDKQDSISKYEVLLLDNGRFYDHPKGHVETGEELKKTAQRELYEETNLDLIIISKGPITIVDYSYSGFNRTVLKRVHYFGGIIHPLRKVRISNEHVGFKWLCLSDALEILTYDTAKDALNAGISWVNSDVVTQYFHNIMKQRKFNS